MSLPSLSLPQMVIGRSLVNTHALTKGGRPAWVPENAAFFIDGVNDRAWINGHTYNSLAAMIASADADFTRAGSGLYQSINSDYSSFASGQLRRGDKGILIEVGAANRIKTSDMTGAAAGTPGTLPNNGWSTASLSNGVQRSVVGIGEEHGLDYIDLRFAGTATAAFRFFLNFTNTMDIAKVNGDTVTLSAFMRKVSGALYPQGALGLAKRTAAGGNIAGDITNSLSDLQDTIEKRQLTGTMNDPATAFVIPYASFQMLNGSTYDCVIRIYNPTLSDGSVNTTPIITTNGAVTRPDDALTLYPNQDTCDITATFYGGSTQLLEDVSMVGGWTAPTNLNQRYIETILGVAA